MINFHLGGGGIVDRPRGRKATARAKLVWKQFKPSAKVWQHREYIVLFGTCTGNGCWPISIVLR